jgi:hypothetical protein
MRVENEMTASYFKKGTPTSPMMRLRTILGRLIEITAVSAPRGGIRASVRTTNRLLISLWLSLPFALCFSSDWIGTLVLWQAMSGSLRLLQSSANRNRTAENTSLNMIQGGYRER